MTIGRVGLVVAAIGALVIGLVSCRGSQSVRDYVSGRCAATGSERDPQGRRADGFSCPGKPVAFAAALAGRHEPARRRSTPTGHFLRYRNEMVGIFPARGRTKVLLARERDGYGYFNNYIGGFWGSYGGRGESFRGGGPGAGK